MNKEELERQHQEWHQDPNNWKWGIFYYNPEDKRLLPPKRVKLLGWTINFANPLSILTLLALIGISWLIINLIRQV